MKDLLSQGKFSKLNSIYSEAFGLKAKLSLDVIL